MYYPHMPSIVGKRRGKHTYYYLVESARVDGQPRIVSQQYLGTAEEVMARLSGTATGEPARSQHKQFGDLAAVWSMLERLDVAGVIDQAVPRYANAAASVGTYIALAIANRIVDPCSKRGFGDWWATTAGPRWVKLGQAAVDHRRFWDAMDRLGEADLRRIETTLGRRMVAEFGLDLQGLVLDMTNFATVIDKLVARYRDLAAQVESLTVVYDAGQNSAANHQVVEALGVGFVGSLPPSDHPELLAVPRSRYTPVDADRYPGLSCVDTTCTALGVTRRAVLTHSATLHAAQSRGLDQSLAKAHRRLGELQAKLAGGKTRRQRPAVEAELAAICKPCWVGQVITTTLTGDRPAQLRLSWRTDTRPRQRLETRLFGKRILFTNRDTWPVADVVAAYRSQSEVEAGFRQMKDPQVVSFSPMHHWTDQKIRVHVFYCVLALAIAHLLRRQADHAGLHLSVRELLAELAGIQETVLLYHDGGKGRPRARRMLTDMDPTQQRLADLFDIHRYAPTR